MDVLVFIVLGLAVALANRRVLPGALGLVWVAALLKIYPGASLLAFVRKKVDFVAAGMAAASLAVYVLAMRGQLKLLNAIVAQTDYESFGRQELFLILSQKLEKMGHPAELLHQVIPILVFLAYTILIAILAIVFGQRGSNMDWELSRGVMGWAFSVGALIYCTCWSLGMNLNYRYTFVAMTLPQAWAWATASGRWRWLYVAYLGSALAMAWLTLFQFSHPWIEGEHALLGWVLYGMLLFTLIVTYWRLFAKLLDKGTASPSDAHPVPAL